VSPSATTTGCARAAGWSDATAAAAPPCQGAGRHQR
jgi:hypothetical protein